MRFFVGHDCSGHQYLVPADKAAEWDTWTDIPEEDERAWEEPAYAKRIEGGRMTFERPMLDDVDLTA